MRYPLQTDLFLITDFFRIAAHSAELQRAGTTPSAKTSYKKLPGKLDVVILVEAEHGSRVSEPSLSIKHPGGEHLPGRLVGSDVHVGCAVTLPILHVNWRILCEVVMEPVIVGEQCGMWILRFLLPQKYWKSRVKLVLGREQSKSHEVNIDLSKLR